MQGCKGSSVGEDGCPSVHSPGICWYEIQSTDGLFSFVCSCCAGFLVHVIRYVRNYCLLLHLCVLVCDCECVSLSQLSSAHLTKAFRPVAPGLTNYQTYGLSHVMEFQGDSACFFKGTMGRKLPRHRAWRWTDAFLYDRGHTDD